MSPQHPDFAMGRVEFIALLAMMFSTIAFTVDAMLPALPEIGAELSPEDPTRGALVLTFFILGMGLGTFIAGPLSDSFGRRRIIFIGAAIYIICAAIAWRAQTIEVMLAARVLQGIGAAGPRVVALAIVRDLFSGREMARIMSFVMLIFTIAPAIAPAIGAVLMMYGGWRAIFLSFIVFAGVFVIWMGIRLPETLAHENRRPFRPRLMLAATREMFAHRTVCLSIFVQVLTLAMLFLTLLQLEQTYSRIFDQRALFPYWTGGIALIGGSASLLNAVLVVRYGMQRLITVTLGFQIFLSGAMIIASFWTLPAPFGFAAFLFWQLCMFFQAGLTIGNLNAIAMEPMGHIAGMAASVIGAVSTILAALIASPLGLIFDGTLRPLLMPVFIMAIIAQFLMRQMVRDDT